MLGMDPLEVTVLSRGTMAHFRSVRDIPIKQVNPGKFIVDMLLDIDAGRRVRP